MGDLLGSPRVAPLSFSSHFFSFYFLRRAYRSRRPRTLASGAQSAPDEKYGAPKRRGDVDLEKSAEAPRVAPVYAAVSKCVAASGSFIRIGRAYADGCDHTNTNAPDPIRTPQLSVFGRE